MEKLYQNEADPVFNQFEKIPTSVFNTSQEASLHVAQLIRDVIKEKASKNEKCILGLATGSTPTRVYYELVKMHREEGLSFKNVITFNLDEYYPMPKDSLQSYNMYMKIHLFDHIDILPENINIPDGTLPFPEVEEFCRVYEEKITKLGIDIQILGIGFFFFFLI